MDLGQDITLPTPPFKIHTGYILPGILLSEVNSTCGDVIGQIARDVYDTVGGGAIDTSWNTHSWALL